MKSCTCVTSFISNPRKCKLTGERERRFLVVWEWSNRNWARGERRLKKDTREPTKVIGKLGKF